MHDDMTKMAAHGSSKLRVVVESRILSRGKTNGVGSEQFRAVTQYFDVNGTLLAENDWVQEADAGRAPQLERAIVELRDRNTALTETIETTKAHLQRGLGSALNFPVDVLAQRVADDCMQSQATLGRLVKRHSVSTRSVRALRLAVASDRPDLNPLCDTDTVLRIAATIIHRLLAEVKNAKSESERVRNNAEMLKAPKTAPLARKGGGADFKPAKRKAAKRR